MKTKIYNTQNVYFHTNRKVIGVAYRVPEGVKPEDVIIVEILEDT